MANRTQDEVRREFFASRGGHDKPPRFRWSGNTVIQDGTLWYVPSRRGDRIQLARFTGAKREILLINGEAFLNNGATAEQNALRRAVEIREDGTRNPRAWHTPPEAEAYTGMTVPYAALLSAEIDLDSIRAIHISPDRWDEEFHEMPDPPNAERLVAGDYGEEWVMTNHPLPPQNEEAAGYNRVYEGRVGNRLFRVDVRRQNGRDETTGNRIPIGPWGVRTYMLRAMPQNGVMGWQELENAGSAARPQWRWRERIHRLGASVFSGNGPDGRRHRYISAFDQQEPTPMYYLAQLPDRGKCEDYNDAIDLLAPEIVKRAREEGRQVYRQGDVFAIELNLTTEDIYSRALYRVRRQVVLQNPNAIRDPRALIPPAEGEVVERVPCPLCECRGHLAGYGPKAVRALMIHGTSHTADEVVIARKGVTYVRGSMYHDPRLEEEGREPEHRTIALWDDEIDGRKQLHERKWYLAVRNTVPRQRRRAPQTVQEQEVAEEQQAQEEVAA